MGQLIVSDSGAIPIFALGCSHVDSVGKPLENNLYGYVENDPINWIDPLGLSKTKGITQGQDAYFKALKDTQGDRTSIDKIKTAAEAEHDAGKFSAKRWKNIKAWIKLAKDGRLFSEPLLLMTESQVWAINHPGFDPFKVRLDACGNPSN